MDDRGCWMDNVFIERLWRSAHHDHRATAEAFKVTILRHLEELKQLSERKLLDQRYEKFRAFGEWQGK